VFLLGLAASPPAFGQAKTSPIAFVTGDSVTTSLVTAPSIITDTNVSPSSESTQWLKVEFHYATTDLVTDAYPYVDAVEFKIWIEGFDQYLKNSQGGKGVAVALTGSVTYVNVPAGRDLYGSFYVSPSTLVRYSSDRGPGDFDHKFDIHIEAYVNGTMVDEINKNKEEDPLKWFQPLKVIPNLVYRQDQCPFLVSNPDRYPMIKLPPPPQ
jgi:hypothetical protein